MDTLKELLDDHQEFHSDLQMDHFITIRAGGTSYGQYKQALRELTKRYKALKTMYVDRELDKLDVSEAETKAATCPEGITISPRSRLLLAKARMKLEDMNHTIRDAEREFKRFYAQAVALKKKFPDLTPEKRQELDLEMWEHHIQKMAALDFISRGRINENTVSLIQCLPMETRAKLCEAILKDPKKCMDWFWQQEENLPELTIPKESVEVLTDGADTYTDRTRRLSSGDEV